MRSSLLSVALVVALAAPAWAQGGDQSRPPQGAGTQKPAPAQTTKKPAAPRPPIGFRAFFAFESMGMSAASTFNAETGSSTITGFGGGGDVQNVWRRVFVRFGFSKASVDGTRGFVLDDGFISTGVPVEIGVRNIEIAAGWRASPTTQPKLAIYGGGGMLLGSMSKNSPIAEPGDNGSKSSAGYVIFGGLDYAIWKNVVAGAEGQFRSVGGILGDEGTVSGAFNETNAGGAALRAIVGVRFGR